MNKELSQFEEYIYSQVSDNFCGITKTLADSQSMIDDLRSISREKDAIILNLENENQRLMLENQGLLCEKENQTKWIDSQKSDAEFFKNVKIDSVRLTELIQENELQNKQLTKDRANFENEKALLKSENQRLKSDLDEKKKDLSSKQQEFDSFVSDQRKREDELNYTVKELSKENKSLKSKLEEAISCKNDLIEDNSRMEKKIDELTAQGASSSSEETNKPNPPENSSVEQENEMLKKEITELKEDITWLKEYAKGTDRKIKSFYKNQRKDLDDHHDWLCNKPKDDMFKKFFSDDGDHSTDNREESNVSRRREKGLA